MRFYNNSHTYYCGIDLHARYLYVCILDQQGEKRLHKNIKASAVLYLRGNEKAQRYLKQLQKRMPKSKALTVLAHKLGRVVYFMLNKGTGFDENRFLNG